MVRPFGRPMADFARFRALVRPTGDEPGDEGKELPLGRRLRWAIGHLEGPDVVLDVQEVQVGIVQRYADRVGEHEAHGLHPRRFRA